MADTITTEELLKLNLLRLVRDHREHCGADCNISLFLVREVARRAGMEFTELEERLFL